MEQNYSESICVETNTLHPETLEEMDRDAHAALRYLIDHAVGFPTGKKARLQKLKLPSEQQLAFAYCYAVLGFKAKEIEEAASSGLKPAVYLAKKADEEMKKQKAQQAASVIPPKPSYGGIRKQNSEELKKLREEIEALKKEINYWKQKYGKQTELFTSFLNRKISVEDAAAERAALSHFSFSSVKENENKQTETEN